MAAPNPPYGNAEGGYNSNDNLTGGYNGASGYSSGADSGSDILNQCQAIDRTIDELEERLQGLQSLHSRVLNDRATNAEVDRTNSEIMGAYRALGDRLKKVKSNPESGSPRNAPQVGRVDRRLKKAINEYQRVESDFRRQMQEQQARQYRIVKPDASEEEVREAVEDPNTQVFQQAVSAYPQVTRLFRVAVSTNSILTNYTSYSTPTAAASPNPPSTQSANATTKFNASSKQS
jgi:syntaxin 1B/2/3